MKRSTKLRRGLASTMAMLYLVLFSTLALGFYAATTTSNEVVANDRLIASAQSAAESGMDFMRYQLANVSIAPNTPSSDVVTKLYQNLASQLNGSANMAGQTISLTGSTIQIPSSTSGTIKLDSNGDTRFRATITDWAGEIVVKVNGYAGTVGIVRAFSMDFTRQPRPTSLFNFAVASKGQVVMSKGTITTTAGIDPSVATVMSASDSTGAINMSGGTVTGDLNIVDGASVSVTGGTVGTPGSSIPSQILANHVHVVDTPDFPFVDPTVYKQYATNTYSSGAGTQANIIIPPNTNPKFNGNATVQGVMYIQSPNQVTFNGNFNLQGFIVMEGGSSTTDSLNLSGNLTMSPVPNQPQFDALRAVSGVAILAPNAALNMTGSAGGTVKGNIIVNKLSTAGASSMTMTQGSIITLYSGANSAVFGSSKSFQFTATGAGNQPTMGLSYNTYYSPNQSSYQEVTP